MIDLISPAPLGRYMKRIRNWAKSHPSCWGLIYQADVRMRSERCHRILEALVEKYGDHLAPNNKD